MEKRVRLVGMVRLWGGGKGGRGRGRRIWLREGARGVVG